MSNNKLSQSSHSTKTSTAWWFLVSLRKVFLIRFFTKTVSVLPNPLQSNERGKLFLLLSIRDNWVIFRFSEALPQTTDSYCELKWELRNHKVWIMFRKQKQNYCPTGKAFFAVLAANLTCQRMKFRCKKRHRRHCLRHVACRHTGKNYLNENASKKRFSSLFSFWWNYLSSKENKKVFFLFTLQHVRWTAQFSHQLCSKLFFLANGDGESIKSRLTVNCGDL